VFIKKSLNFINCEEHIMAVKEILLGKPTIKGTRLSVDHIVNLLAQGWLESQILESYPSLTNELLQPLCFCIKDH